MSSYQAAAFKLILRILKKRMFTNTDHVALRRMVNNSSRRMPKPPADIDFRSERIDGIPCLWVKAMGAEPDKLILYLHGGGYIFCSAHTTHKDILWRLSVASKCRVIAPDYRLAPEHPYPAALEDAIKVYRWLLDQGYKPENIVIVGDSAGGGLTYGTVLKIRDLGWPLPAATVGMSPWTDLAVTGESVITNLKRDALIPGDGLHEGAQYYLAGASAHDPYASPLYGDPTGLPPTLIQVSKDEVLLDDSRRLAAKYRAAGVPCELELWDGMPHVWQTLSMFIPEGKTAINRIGSFIAKHLHAKDTA
ncbi:MAG TPA: alpha/beta hydrolase [Pseudomonadales bacterium]|jgi:acetyl esterase/lipase|nr:alpha/beta hydrolase [Pseudomonadales bacterium]HNN86295.1 alpha/beta hydrolase [Pseudomonadales bacterium]